MKIVLLAPLFIPPVAFFKAMSDADMAVIDIDLRYDKRFKAMHRTRLAGLHGPTFLTVPIHLPGTSRCTYRDIEVSSHDRWWTNTVSTLDTLYGSTPFYHLYRQIFTEIINDRAAGRKITDFNIDLILAVRELSGIATPLTVPYPDMYRNIDANRIIDLRHHDFYADTANFSAIETLFQTGKTT